MPSSLPAALNLNSPNFTITPLNVKQDCAQCLTERPAFLIESAKVTLTVCSRKMVAQFVQGFVGNNLKSACPAARRQFATGEMIRHDKSLARETAIPISFTRVAK